MSVSPSTIANATGLTYSDIPDADMQLQIEIQQLLTQPFPGRVKVALVAKEWIVMADSPSDLGREVSPEIEPQFYSLTQQWRKETAHLSISNERAMHFAYQQIIGMGEAALPLIFRELRETTSDWFWALRAIARDKAPKIQPEDRGRVRLITEIWLKWGKDHGYVRG